jgi:hypothetical protein
MPELVDANMQGISSEVYRADWRTIELSPADMADIAANYAGEYVDHGGECVVVSPADYTTSDHSPRSEVVVALDYSRIRDPLEAKLIFYTHRVMSTLFPHNFPHFRTSVGSEDQQHGVSATIRDRIFPHTDGATGMVSELDEGSPYPFSRVNQAIRKLDLPVLLDDYANTEDYGSDGGQINYLKGADGGVYYLDIVELLPEEYEKKWDTSKIMSWMEQQNYSPQDRRIVSSGIRRLQQLAKDEPSFVFRHRPD